MSRQTRPPLFILLVTAAGMPAWGQSAFGSIVGTVTDPAGAAVAGAAVEVLNEGTGILRTTTANDSGAYEVTHLIGGRYSVRAAAGFQKYENQGVLLENLRTPRIDVTLALGPIEEHVTVTGAAPVIETESGGISSVRSTRQLQDMPLNLRTMQGSLGDTGAWA